MKHFKTIMKILRMLQLVVVCILAFMLIKAMRLLYFYMRGEGLF